MRNRPSPTSDAERCFFLQPPLSSPPRSGTRFHHRRQVSLKFFQKLTLSFFILFLLHNFYFSLSAFANSREDLPMKFQNWIWQFFLKLIFTIRQIFDSRGTDWTWRKIWIWASTHSRCLKESSDVTRLGEPRESLCKRNENETKSERRDA